jgi:cation diffusion facilitator family transporter
MKLEHWGWYSIALNTLLAVLHATVATASGSLAVTAELIHNAADILSAAAVLAGLNLAMRKSKAFPYGLYKVENVVAVGLAAMIFVSAYEIGCKALLAPVTAVHADGWMLGILAVTGTLPLVFGHFELRAGHAANSPALIADAKEYRVHAFTTGLAFAALASQWLDIPLDHVTALLIIVAVVWMGWGLLRDAMRVLLDASLDAETLLVIGNIIDADPAVRDIKWITGRNAGRFRFVEAGVVLRVAELNKAEAALLRIEARVRAAVPHVERALIHVEASASSYVRYAIPLANLNGTLSRHFGEAPYIALVDAQHSDDAIKEQRIVSNPHAKEAKAKGIRVAEWLVTQKIDVLLTREDVSRKGPAYVLRAAGVELRMTDRQTVDEAVLSALRARTMLR